MKLVNIGSGYVFHRDWINLDIAPSNPYVKRCDIRRGLPFEDAEIDVCYCSHVLEHLTRKQADDLVTECARVLKPNGIIRIAVPDLESIARNYIRALEQVKAGAMEAEANYDWMMLELFDQTVRNVSGGDMGIYLRGPDIPNKEFVTARIGMEGTHYWQGRPITAAEKPSYPLKLTIKRLTDVIRQIRLSLIKKLVFLYGGQEAKEAFSEGLFRNSGEIHRWMYDRFSLGRLLTKSGFSDIQVCRADESRIPYFGDYELDVIDTQIRKPDSLFMEAYRVYPVS